MESSFGFIAFIIAIALIFDFTNGLHDAANSVATIVSTRVLSPKQAVIWAAFFNFVAFLIFGTAVAKTIGTGLIDISVVDPMVILCGLLGAVSWNILTWYWGLPSSSSHSLMGGYLGAAVAKAGFKVVIVSGWVKIAVFIVLAPLLGMIFGIVLKVVTTWIVHKRPMAVVDVWAKRLQFASAALYSLGHGGNDAQKTMGLIAGLMFTSGHMKEFHIPLWIVLSAHTAIALGTLSGGWRIVKTMGQRIVKLKPIDGFCAETASAVSIFTATHMGVPVSTTHVITGAVAGVGAAKNAAAVKWQVTIKIVWAWILTIPMSALCAGLLYEFFGILF
ncbi:MAG: inorganic phosphate transporter [Acidobacteriota bacterium]|jgi:Phosphate/sulphate permeases|nr:inorganic phosphate transporter [Acidobacteriota bacterium]OQB55681.1 MAG: Low-affinity inorganic phosphate transporter 1 [Candidatus Aminicenantes bacterium ADurb.Bin147]HNQ79929.1 inorganic phosphate transporter [Candidatus Aminicenantes bacterium]MDD8028178.1 inorganic phosphate transporter [Acidobacteriota bacterium]MDD8034399.1 inorganic phosphate transporter [Acidobacteriota bacterium]